MYCYLEVEHGFAHGSPKPPSPSHVPQNGDGQTENKNQKVCQGQIDQKNIGDCSHRDVSCNDEDNQEVPAESHDEKKNENWHPYPVHNIRRKNLFQKLCEFLVSQVIVRSHD